MPGAYLRTMGDWDIRCLKTAAPTPYSATDCWMS